MTLRPPASARERLDWLRLIRTEHVGPATFASLLARFGNASRALSALPELAARGGARRAIAIPTSESAERECAALTALGGQFIAQGEPLYPPLLAEIEGAPPLLAVLGAPALLAKPALAVVGARNASAAGIRLTRLLAGELGAGGLVIVSGLARGIDTAAHEAALASGTAGVLAGGLDVVYPPENRRLYEAMRAQGALLSEMPLGTAPQARHFPRRNRIISGLARAVLVIEAAERSGSLITARFALEQGREVMAVPGSPLDPRSRGTNRLIRDGAALIQETQDVIDLLSNLPLQATPPPAGFDDPPIAVNEVLIDAVRRDLLTLLGPTAIDIDELIRQTGVPAAAIMAALTELELAGRIERLGGQKVSRTGDD